MLLLSSRGVLESTTLNISKSAYTSYSQSFLPKGFIEKMSSLSDLEKRTTFTTYLPPDSEVPSIEVAESSDSNAFRKPRIISSGFFTWLKPEWYDKDDIEYKLVAVSPAAVKDLGLRPDIANDPLFVKTLAGRHIFENTYPWAQAYSGYQFGQFAGQLGDGRVVSLFEAVNPDTGKSYELQLKGAGLTPFSRFADGKAVLRSSIREALGSEAVNALGIPTTRALALINLPNMTARRERIESCAMVCRMAESWVRLGNFDFARTKGKAHVVTLAKYCVEHVFNEEWKKENGPLDKRQEFSQDKQTNIESRTTEATLYRWLYHKIIEKNARTTALWQAYGFLNGVLNTDNISVLGLSLDYGPFAFMETFDKMYTPNHDDALGRYSYRAIPSVMVWNLIRLGEDLGELLGVTSDDLANGFETKSREDLGWSEAKQKEVVESATTFIEESIENFQKLFKDAYTRIMCQRLGLQQVLESDHDDILTPLLEMLQDCELDYNLFLYRLSNVEFTASEDSLPDPGSFFPKDRGVTMYPLDRAKEMLNNWLLLYYNRLQQEKRDGLTDLERNKDRQQRMKRVNPKFILRNWILDEVIADARKGDFTKYHTIQRMALEPFNDTWGLDPAEEQRLTNEAPSIDRNAQCSCSS